MTTQEIDFILKKNLPFNSFKPLKKHRIGYCVVVYLGMIAELAFHSLINFQIGGTKRRLYSLKLNFWQVTYFTFAIR